MAVSGQGTTYNLPNYHGELFEVTPVETPFLSAIGGLAGAKTTQATQFEWQTVDRRASSASNTALEGAALPTAAERVRSNVDNVVEIHQSAIELSYTKLAATGQFSGANIIQANDPTINEIQQQTMAELESIAVDIEKSFLNGVYQKPTDNTTKRQTRGLLSAIATTNQSNGEALGAGTIVASTGVFTVTGGAEDLAVGDAVDLGAITTTTGVTAGRYYVITVPSSSTFTLSATKGGTALSLTTNGSVASITKAKANTSTALNTLLQSIFDNGGMRHVEQTVVMVGSAQKVALSAAYSTATLNQPTLTRNVGGVAIDTLVTDFGTLGVMLNRWMPIGQLAVVDLSVCAPVFLEIPDKGLLFVEEMPQLGASRRWQLYGEIGLEYGPETFHGLLTDLA